jgi:uncharacterized protein
MATRPVPTDTLAPNPPAVTRARADHAIVVRDLRFNRGAKPRRWWLGGDPVATAWFTSLSATFPRGEAYFVESVKAHRDGVPAELAEDIRKFIVQEVNHSREHLALNRLAAEAGYDIAAIEERVQENLDRTKGRPPIIDLAATMALEHYTAMMAHEFLANPAHLAGSDAEVADLWRWHAIEEIEHKGVAYDTYLHATRTWSRWKRWKLKAVMMVLVTRTFLFHRIDDALNLLAQDGIGGWRAKARLARYLAFSPGVLRRIFPAWASYFLPGFHPWNHDDRALIEGAAAALAARG